MARYHTLLLLATLSLLIERAFGSFSGHALEHCRTHPELYKHVEEFTTEWFRSNVLEDVRLRYLDTNGRFNNALFYTRGMSEVAKEYACKEERITIWEPWHSDLYDDSKLPTNRYSCIHHDAKLRNCFFSNMSEAFATLSTGFVLVMHSSADYDNPPEDGIWAKVERSAIFAKKTTVVMIRKMREMNRSSRMAVWHHVKGQIVGRFEDRIQLLREMGENVVELIRDHFELRSKPREKRVAPQQVLEDDSHKQGKACQKLPVYTLPVDW